MALAPPTYDWRIGANGANTNSEAYDNAEHLLNLDRLYAQLMGPADGDVPNLTKDFIVERGLTPDNIRQRYLKANRSLTRVAALLSALVLNRRTNILSSVIAPITVTDEKVVTSTAWEPYIIPYTRISERGIPRLQKSEQRQNITTLDLHAARVVIELHFATDVNYGLQAWMRELVQLSARMQFTIDLEIGSVITVVGYQTFVEHLHSEAYNIQAAAATIASSGFMLGALNFGGVQALLMTVMEILPGIDTVILPAGTGIHAEQYISNKSPLLTTDLDRDPQTNRMVQVANETGRSSIATLTIGENSIDFVEMPRFYIRYAQRFADLLLGSCTIATVATLDDRVMNSTDRNTIAAPRDNTVEIYTMTHTAGGNSVLRYDEALRHSLLYNIDASNTAGEPSGLYHDEVAKYRDKNEIDRMFENVYGTSDAGHYGEVAHDTNSRESQTHFRAASMLTVMNPITRKPSIPLLMGNFHQQHIQTAHFIRAALLGINKTIGVGSRKDASSVLVRTYTFMRNCGTQTPNAAYTKALAAAIIKDKANSELTPANRVERYKCTPVYGYNGVRGSGLPHVPANGTNAFAMEYPAGYGSLVGIQIFAESPGGNSWGAVYKEAQALANEWRSLGNKMSEIFGATLLSDPEETYPWHHEDFPWQRPVDMGFTFTEGGSRYVPGFLNLNAPQALQGTTTPGVTADERTTFVDEAKKLTSVEAALIYIDGEFSTKITDALKTRGMAKKLGYSSKATAEDIKNDIKARLEIIIQTILDVSITADQRITPQDKELTRQDTVNLLDIVANQLVAQEGTSLIEFMDGIIPRTGSTDVATVNVTQLSNSLRKPGTSGRIPDTAQLKTKSVGNAAYTNAFEKIYTKKNTTTAVAGSSSGNVKYLRTGLRITATWMDVVKDNEFLAGDPRTHFETELKKADWGVVKAYLNPRGDNVRYDPVHFHTSQNLRDPKAFNVEKKDEVRPTAEHAAHSVFFLGPWESRLRTLAASESDPLVQLATIVLLFAYNDYSVHYRLNRAGARLFDMMWLAPNMRLETQGIIAMQRGPGTIVTLLGQILFMPQNSGSASQVMVNSSFYLGVAAITKQNILYIPHVMPHRVIGGFTEKYLNEDDVRSIFGDAPARYGSLFPFPLPIGEKLDFPFSLCSERLLGADASDSAFVRHSARSWLNTVFFANNKESAENVSRVGHGEADSPYSAPGFSTVVHRRAQSHPRLLEGYAPMKPGTGYLGPVRMNTGEAFKVFNNKGVARFPSAELIHAQNMTRS